ncbi:MAG: immunoglobulin domain-containing protein [Verrucomicrobia subdivision 3 bacterium]|nr:immunoglobulin domain-containing protein [Limisphaerales bacterium]
MQGCKILRISGVLLVCVAAPGLPLTGHAQIVATNWQAFNDHRPSAATHPNATGYDMRQTGDGGILKDYFSGGVLPVSLVINSFGTIDDFGANGYPAMGTPAYELFNGILDVGNTGTMPVRNRPAGVVSFITLTFTNLDPSQKYYFRGTSCRANSAYVDRWTVVSLQDAVSFQDAHTAGVVDQANSTGYPLAAGFINTLTNGQAAWNSGDNVALGALIGWNEIDPGPDGSFSIRVDQYIANPLPNGSAPNLGTYGYSFTAIYLAEVGIPVPVSITGHPTGQTLLECRSFTLTVSASGSFPRSVQWLKGDEEIPGATNTTYTVDAAQTSDSGVYRARVTNPVNTQTSNPATVTVNEDTIAPLIAGVSSVNANEVGVLFNEIMDPTTTSEPFGYTVDGAQSVTNVIMFPGNRGAILQSSVPVANTFTVGVTDARDCSLNQIAGGTTANGTKWADSSDVGPPALTGHALAIDVGDADVIAGGRDIWDASDEFHFVYNQRSGDFDVTVKVQRLDPANNWSKAGLLARESLDTASRTIEAYTTPDRPPGTRSYEAGRRPEPATATLDWGGRPPSPLPNAWVRLRRNDDTWRAYWGTNGTDWTLYAGPAMQVMTPELLVGLATTSHDVNLTTIAEFRDMGDFAYPGASLAFNPAPQSASVQANTREVSFSGRAVATGAPQSEIHYQWQRSPDGTTWTNVPGATGTNISLSFPTGDDTGDSFRLVASIPGATLTSPAATLTLTPDTVRPRLVSAVGISSTAVIAFFSEPMDSPSLDQFAISIEPGITVATAAVNPANPLRVDITTAVESPLTIGNTYTLIATAFDNGGIFSGAVDRSLNPVDPNPASAQFVSQNYPGDPNALVFVPTNTKRSLGSLTERGFDGRMVQIAATIANSLAVAEQMLAGTYINPATGQPYPNLAPQPTFVEPNVVNYLGSGGAGSIMGDTQFPGYVGPADNMAMEILTYVEMQPGLYRMGVNSDDGFRVSPATSVNDPNNAITLGQFDGGRGVADTVFDMIVTEEGLYPMRLIWEEGQGDAACEWWVESLVDSSRTLINGSDAIRAFRPPSGGGAPTIAVTRGTGTITLSWTDAEGAYILESSASLSAPSWSNVSGVMGAGGNFSVTITLPATGNRFYRLYK